MSCAVHASLSCGSRACAEASRLGPHRPAAQLAHTSGPDSHAAPARVQWQAAGFDTKAAWYRDLIFKGLRPPLTIRQAQEARAWDALRSERLSLLEIDFQDFQRQAAAKEQNCTVDELMTPVYLRAPPVPRDTDGNEVKLERPPTQLKFELEIVNTGAQPMQFQAATIAELATRNITSEDGKFVRMCGFQDYHAMDMTLPEPTPGFDAGPYTYPFSPPGARRPLRMI